MLPLGNGVMAAGAYVPLPGETEGNATTGTNGGYELTVKNANGFVTVTHSATTQGQVTPNTDAACSEGAYYYEGPYWYSANSYPTLGWWYNSSTASRAGLSAWGHAFGLAHVTNQADAAEVMYPVRPWCQLRRHLGEGDYNGMGARY